MHAADYGHVLLRERHSVALHPQTSDANAAQVMQTYVHAAYNWICIIAVGDAHGDVEGRMILADNKPVFTADFWNGK